MTLIQKQEDDEVETKQSVTAVIVVAHPDDETLWAGGTVLMHPDWQWMVVSLTRGDDPDRAPRFLRAVQKLGATASIGNLNDEPGQPPLDVTEVQQVLLSILPRQNFDLILTHSPCGEYTRHRRHEETSAAVTALWEKDIIRTDEVWLFAYGDSGRGGRDDLPGVIKTAHRLISLPETIWQQKRRIITEIYGFSSESYEAHITLRQEAFWRFRSAGEFHKWLVNIERREQ
ncbi:MAG: PIG-L family deacetylase [Dehalococcoidales bacterium]|nr:PIG-L family deacetylase [Dehalococcoidales bacterium]